MSRATEEEFNEALSDMGKIYERQLREKWKQRERIVTLRVGQTLLGLDLHAIQCLLERHDDSQSRIDELEAALHGAELVVQKLIAKGKS